MEKYRGNVENIMSIKLKGISLQVLNNTHTSTFEWVFLLDSGSQSVGRRGP